MWQPNRRFTIGSLLVLVAASAVIFNMMRPPTPPDEGQAILIAKAYLLAHSDFNYPEGYWTRAVWNQKRSRWQVGFVPARKDAGSSQLIEVLPDRSCFSAPMDITFFDLW